MPKTNNMSSKHKWYDIKAAGKKNADIYIYSEIGYWGITARQFAHDLQELGELDQITAHINSIGGNVGDGIAIYNTLKKHRAHVTIEIDGYCLSIATVVAMAGDMIRMAANTLFMIHNPWGGAIGDAAQLRKEADIMERHKTALINTYAARTGLEYEVLSQLMDEETWYNAEEAHAAGFVDEITDAIDLATAAQALPGDFNAKRFKNIPRTFCAPPARSDSIINEVTDMPDTTKGNKLDVTPAEDATFENMRENVLQQEKQRRDDIYTLFKPFSEQHGKLRDQCLDDAEITVTQARQHLLYALGRQGPGPLGADPHITVGETTEQKFRQGAILALGHRAGIVTSAQNVGNEYRGFTLLEMARRTLDINGVSTAGMDKMQIVGAAFTHSSSDFPHILEDTMHKVLLAAYAEAPDTWRQFCARGAVSDFKEHARLRMGSFGRLDTINENGEYRYKSLNDAEKEKIAAGSKGNLVNVTRVMVINDDLDAFARIPRMLGRAAKRSVEIDAYAVLASNPVMADGKALFHVDHGNLIDPGAPINTANVDATRVLMAKQKDPNGNDYLDIRPAVFLTPVELGGTARVAMSSEFEVGGQKNNTVPNMVRNIAEVVDSARLSGTAWYLFADPADEAVIEVVFLDGNEEPFLDMEEAFTVDGATYKVRLDYGVGAVGTRGAVKNPGA